MSALGLFIAATIVTFVAVFIVREMTSGKDQMASGCVWTLLILFIVAIPTLFSMVFLVRGWVCFGGIAIGAFAASVVIRRSNEKRAEQKRRWDEISKRHYQNR